jgi:dTDP-4-dehydrorhamnose 3,5-epimerase
MSNFKFTETDIKGLFVIEQKIFNDDRGYFMETYNEKAFKDVGLDVRFVQDNQSKSKSGVLRGLHFQKEHPQGKLVRAIKGEIFDVAVDLRKNSPTFKKWFGCILSDENRKQLYVPEGFAHGFLVLSEEAEFSYKCTDFYHPEDEGGCLWNDPAFNIQWPLHGIDKLLLSEKDKKYSLFSNESHSYDL